MQGVKGRFPNGNEGFMWSNGRVACENGALLSVINGLGYPDAAAGSNDQGLVMYFEGNGQTGLIYHDDQYRGVAIPTSKASAPAARTTITSAPTSTGWCPGKGRATSRSATGTIRSPPSCRPSRRIEAEAAGLAAARPALERRREIIREVDAKGLIATPANSYINELVVEAARMSILKDAAAVRIVYGDHPHVELD